MFKECLYSSFYDWLKLHREIIGEKHYGWAYEEMEKSWETSNTPIYLIGVAMWMFMAICNLGVMAGIGPCSVNIVEIPKEFDEKATKRVLMNISSCLSLQYLPPEIGKQQIPNMTGPPWRFKLAEYIQAQR